MARPIKTSTKTDNKKVIQSYILTTARYKFTVTEKRILYRIIEAAQAELQGILIKDNLCRVNKGLWDVELTMPYKAILDVETDDDGEAHHRDRIRAAAKALATKAVEIRDSESGDWWCSSIIHGIHCSEKTGTITFKVDDFLWKAMLDFTDGFRNYELMTAMKFRSAYTMRFYELMAGQTNRLPFSIEELKTMVGAQNKYKNTVMFIKRIIEPAKAELDKSAPYSFTYELETEGKKITGIRLYPKHIRRNENQELKQKFLNSQVSAKVILDNEVWNYLLHNLNFTNEEVNKNKETFIKGQQTIPDYIGFLSDLRGGARTAKNPKGYIINAIRRKIAELSGNPEDSGEADGDEARDVNSIARNLADKFSVNK